MDNVDLNTWSHGVAYPQISFFIIVSSSDQYAEYLGGTATFSGLVIGIPTVFSGLALIPLTKLDQGAIWTNASLPLTETRTLQADTRDPCTSLVPQHCLGISSTASRTMPISYTSFSSAELSPALDSHSGCTPSVTAPTLG